MDVEVTTSVFKKAKAEELEVTGVSRSGRVRKKSSLLADFESPDEIDPRYKRKVDRIREKELRNVVECVEQEEGNDSDLEADGPVYAQDDDDDENIDAMDDEDDSDLGDDEEGSLIVDTDGNRKRKLTNQSQSVYFMEKSLKKNLIIKDGKIIGRTKAVRKDKGKTRFTAYMLWAREVRKEIMKQRPELDFVAMSKRLGELWATVPNSEKYNWKRRARRLAAKGTSTQATESVRRWSAAAVTSTSSGLVPPPSITPFRPQVVRGSTAVSAAVVHSNVATVKSAVKAPAGPKSPPISKGGPTVSDPVVGPGLYKVVGTAPIDVAAHLKLLGESLSIIGLRLKEHEGQIAVSGSLSVLLDSMLCSLGPLLCLTQVIPELDGCSSATLAKVLDNIAYIMPGL